MTLITYRLPQRFQAGLKKIQKMKIVSVSGLSGGMGATTLTAELASTLVSHGREVIALDFSPRNTLRLRYGMAWRDGRGLIPQLLNGQPWNEAAYRCENGVIYLPFGQCQEEEIEVCLEPLRQEAGWLTTRLAQISESEESLILIDCSYADHELISQAKSASDLCIIVMDTDPLSYASLAASRLLKSVPSETPKTFYVLNRFDPQLEFDRDIANVLKVELANHWCPVKIHRDESIREALACKLSVDAYAPHSQATGDFSALATWLLGQLVHDKERVF